MKEYSIGFRLKFDDVEPEDIVNIIADFLKKFDRYEIKVTKNIISSGKILVLLEASERLASGKYSLHLPKDVLFNTQSYAEIDKLIKMLLYYKSTKKVNLITHIPYSNFQKYLKYLSKISTELPENYILLLENEEMDRNNCKYLMQIDKLCNWLYTEKITNVGICLDIGHLLFGFYKEGITQENALKQLKRMSYILSKTKQIHIHDYCKTDHLQLGNGLMNLESVSKFIVDNGLIVPIIIETTVKKPEIDGIKQISIMNQKLKSIKEMI